MPQQLRFVDRQYSATYLLMCNTLRAPCPIVQPVIMPVPAPVPWFTKLEIPKGDLETRWRENKWALIAAIRHLPLRH